MKEEELAAIRKRLVGTTPGPWFAGPQNSDGQNFVWTGEKDELGPAVSIEVTSHNGGWKVDLDRQQADADFIAHAREDVEQLLDAVLEYERLLNETRHRLDNALARYS